MDLVSSIRKSGSRGGVNFSWDEVASSAHRENYLGHSLKAPVGRWQKGRDLEWYAKNGDADAGPSDETEEEKAARIRREEIKRVKEAEEDALARALGLPVKQRNQTGSNSVEIAKPRIGPREEPAEEPKEVDAADRRKHRRHDDSERRHRRRHRSRSRSRDRRRDRSPRGRDEGARRARDSRRDDGRRRDHSQGRAHDRPSRRQDDDSHKHEHRRNRSHSRERTSNRSHRSQRRDRSRSRSRSPRVAEPGRDERHRPRSRDRRRS